MQEALLQGCRRSARLLKRAASSTVSGLPHTATRALHRDAEAAPDAAEPKRRRRRTAPANEDAAAEQTHPQDSKQQQQQQQQRDVEAGAADQGQLQLQALGSITNRPDVLASLDTAAGTVPKAAAAAPAVKRPRGRPPRAATAAAAAAAAAEKPADAAAAAASTDAAPADAAGAQPAAAAAAGGAGKPAGKASKPPAGGSRKKGSASSSSSGSKASAGCGPTRAAEQQLWGQGYRAVAGVDEAGRGPLAGPVVAAAAVLPPGVEFELLNDSKQMSEEDREAVYEQLTSHPEVSYAVAVVDAATIDRINILQAAMLAMRTAVEGLEGAGLKPDHLLIDGNRKPSGLDDTPAQLVVKGDASVTCIAAASVLAKVTRDRMMLDLDRQYPQYGFAQHKGYGVPAHKAAIQQHGPCPIHRRSFEPVKSLTRWPGYPKPPGPAAGTLSAVAVRQQRAGGVGGGGGGGGGGAAAIVKPAGV